MSQAEIDSICEQFEAEWVAGRQPQIEDFLDRVGKFSKSRLLLELLQIELWWTHQRSEQNILEYQQRFPEQAETIRQAWKKFQDRTRTIGRPLAEEERQTHAIFAQQDSAIDDTCAPGSTTGSCSEEHSSPLQGRAGSEVQTHTKLGQYALVERLGKGAFGEVWKADRTGKFATTQVAIKIPNDTYLASRIIRAEAQSWVRASGHPNVVPIIEADSYGDVAAIVSEYVAGGTLADAMKERPITSPEALEIAIGVLSGLEFLHSKQIVHRDLKPANILLQHGIPRLTDFGLAQLEDSGLRGVAGTPAFMAPEAFDGKASVKSDLWSVGVVLFEMLVNRRPFSSVDSSELVKEICSADDVAVPDHLPDMIREVLRRSLRKDSKGRYGSAAEMRAALSNCRRRVVSWDTAGHALATPRHLTIAVTGSMDADPVKVEQRLKTVLASYHAPLTTWYTGSDSSVDEQAAAMLVAASQQVCIVGYTKSNRSPLVSELIDKCDLPFIDVRGESLPDVPNAPSKRDIFFATKSDLVILIWDGKSNGTRILYEWLQRINRDHLMVYL